MTENEITVNGVEYVRKDSVVGVKSSEGLPYVMVRTYSAGVFVGYLKERNGKEVELLYARRLWYWSGAASLSQLATVGTSDPKNCKFPTEVNSVILTEAIEIIPVTPEAKKSISGVGVWEK